MDIRLVRLGPVDENSPVYQSGHYDDDQINLYRSEKTTLIYQPQAKHPLILSQPRYLFQDEVSHILKDFFSSHPKSDIPEHIRSNAIWASPNLLPLFLHPDVDIQKMAVPLAIAFYKPDEADFSKLNNCAQHPDMFVNLRIIKLIFDLKLVGTFHPDSLVTYIFTCASNLFSQCKSSFDATTFGVGKEIYNLLFSIGHIHPKSEANIRKGYAHSLWVIFKSTHDATLLNQAIEHVDVAVSKIQEDTLGIGEIYGAQSSIYAEKATISNDIKDFEAAIEAGEKCIVHMPNDATNKIHYLFNLTSAYNQKNILSSSVSSLQATLHHCKLGLTLSDHNPMMKLQFEMLNEQIQSSIDETSNNMIQLKSLEGNISSLTAEILNRQSKQVDKFVLRIQLAENLHKRAIISDSGESFAEAELYLEELLEELPTSHTKYAEALKLYSVCKLNAYKVSKDINILKKSAVILSNISSQMADSNSILPYILEHLIEHCDIVVKSSRDVEFFKIEVATRARAIYLV